MQIQFVADLAHQLPGHRLLVLAEGAEQRVLADDADGTRDATRALVNNLERIASKQLNPIATRRSDRKLGSSEAPSPRFRPGPQ